MSPCVMAAWNAVRCAVKNGRNADAADASTNAPFPVSRDFMQMPPNAAAEQVRENCHPSLGGLPCARMSNPLPPMLRVWDARS